MHAIPLRGQISPPLVHHPAKCLSRLRHLLGFEAVSLPAARQGSCRDVGGRGHHGAPYGGDECYHAGCRIRLHPASFMAANGIHCPSSPWPCLGRPRGADRKSDADSCQASRQTSAGSGLKLFRVRLRFGIEKGHSTELATPATTRLGISHGSPKPHVSQPMTSSLTRPVEAPWAVCHPPPPRPHHAGLHHPGRCLPAMAASALFSRRQCGGEASGRALVK